MNNDKLKVPVSIRGTNRTFRLQPPAPERGRLDYYIRFDVPRDLRALNPKLPKTVWQSVGTNILAVAKLKARDKIEAIFAGRWSEVEKSKLTGESYATLDQVLDAYQPDPRVVKAAIAGKNRSTLKLLVREATGSNNPGNLTADVWATAAMLQKWIRIRLARVKGADYLQQERAAITINACLAQARSVLSPKVMDLYRELRLPDLTEFRAVHRLKAEKDVSYRPLPQTCLDAIEKDAKRLKVEDPEVYKAYLLMSRLGLRNSEVEAARWSWIERNSDGSADLVIERRRDFVTKNRSYRRLQIDPELLRELDTWRGLPDAWIIEAEHKTQRYNIAHRRLNAWLRQFLPPREKGAYELRKHAASIIVSRPENQGGGIAAAADFLGDLISTTEKHYAKYLRRVRGISTAEISRLPAVA